MTKIEQTGVTIRMVVVNMKLGGFSRVERVIGRLCHLIPVRKLVVGPVLVNLAQMVLNVSKASGTRVNKESLDVMVHQGTRVFDETDSAATLPSNGSLANLSCRHIGCSPNGLGSCGGGRGGSRVGGCGGDRGGGCGGGRGGGDRLRERWLRWWLRWWP